MTCRTSVTVSWTEVCASFITESKILKCDTTLNCYSNVYGEFLTALNGRLADLINVPTMFGYNSKFEVFKAVTVKIIMEYYEL